MKHLVQLGILMFLFSCSNKHVNNIENSKKGIEVKQNEVEIDSFNVNDIKNIQDVPYIENCNDKIFWNLVKQGKKNIPNLIDKLTDETILEDAYVPMFGGKYTVADVSLTILNEKIKGIPVFELIGEKFSEECGYCAYWYFVREKKENRKKLQSEFKKWYKKNENKLVWVQSQSSLTGDCFSPAKGHYEIRQ